MHLDFHTLCRLQCLSMLYFEEFLVVLNKWGMWLLKLSNHTINEAERGRSSFNNASLRRVNFNLLIMPLALVNLDSMHLV